MDEGKQTLSDSEKQANPGQQPAEPASPSSLPRPSGSTGAGYEIRVKDHLAACWYEWFEGWTITNLPEGEFVLSGSNVDPAALHGALNKIRDLNLMLLSVTRTPVEE
jgi:hypothetical protein